MNYRDAFPFVVAGTQRSFLLSDVLTVKIKNT